MKADKIKIINDTLEILDEQICKLGVDSLKEFQEPMNEISHEQFQALATLYANPGFRSYLLNAINLAIKNSALRSQTVEDIVFSKARILTLKELLVKSKRAFENFEKLKSIAQKNAT